MSGLRFRRVVVTGELIEAVLRTGYAPPFRVIEGMPEGARFRSAGTLTQGGRRDVALIFEHDSFEPWEPGSGSDNAPDHPIVVGSVAGPLRVVPGDVLVVRYPQLLSDAQRLKINEHLSKFLERAFGHRIRAIVLDQGGDLGVLLRPIAG